MKTILEERTFEFSEGTSDKFWSIALEPLGFTVRYGRRGTQGQEKTKEFTSEAAARKEYDKLIAEKLGKGYRESGAAPAPGPSAKPAPPAPKPPKPAPPPVVATNGVDLAPEDWLFATWRPRAIRPWPAAPKFTQEDGLARLQKFHDKAQASQWTWEVARIPPRPSPEEARFWLLAMLRVAELNQRIRYQGFSRDLARLMPEAAAFDCARELPVDAVLERLHAMPDVPDVSAAILQPLLALYPLAQVEHFLRQLRQPGPATSVWAHTSIYSDDSFRLHVLPYLTEAELAGLRDATGTRVSALAGDGLIQRLAPLVGLHDEILTLARGSQTLPRELLFGLGSAELVIEHFTANQCNYDWEPRQIRAWLAHTELSALEPVIDSLGAQGRTYGTRPLKTLLSCLRGEAAVAGVAKVLDGGVYVTEAREWFDAHPEISLAGLRALSSTLSAAGQSVVKSLAHRCGEAPAEAAVAVAAALPEGLAEAFANTRAMTKTKAPKWISAAELPPILLRAGGALPPADADYLLAVLASAAPRPVHPLLLCLKCYATEASLDTFAEALFQRWREAGMSGKEKWALLAMGALGSDRCALRLAPQVREWPGESKHQAAVWGLECLRLIGTDTAIMQINLLAQKAKFQALKKNAQETMEAIAADRGLTRDELEDRIVPDLGLDARGTRRFDFGPRQFVMRLNGSLEPVVVDAEGQRRGDLPKPTAKDDAALAAEAVSEFKLLKKQLKETVKVQVARLEQALVTQRRWSPADFDTLVVKHPLMGSLVRPLVWGAFDAANQPVGSFRVTEDFTFADAQDDVFTLPEGAVVGVLHPAHADRATLGRWGEVLADYELIQPFPQLARTVRTLTTEELRSTAIVRHTDAKLEPVVFAGILKRLGWFHGEVGDGGSYTEHVKWFPSAGVTAVFQHTWLSIGYYDTDPVAPECLYFLPEKYGRPGWASCHEGQGRVALSQVDPVVVSEVLGDLGVIAGKAAEVKA